jgi:ABC-type multidrug transport system fused ATPase/permease subunit
LRAGREIHEQMIDKILHAPANLYFDVTPVGRILNKFSKDLKGLEA